MNRPSFEFSSPLLNHKTHLVQFHFSFSFSPPILWPIPIYFFPISLLRMDSPIANSKSCPSFDMNSFWLCISILYEIHYFPCLTRRFPTTDSISYQSKRSHPYLIFPSIPCCHLISLLKIYDDHG